MYVHYKHDCFIYMSTYYMIAKYNVKYVFHPMEIAEKILKLIMITLHSYVYKPQIYKCKHWEGKATLSMFVCLCFTSLQQRGHLETAPPFTVPCKGRETR